MKKEDEIYNLVKNTLNDIEISYNIIDNIEEITKIDNKKEDLVIYHWNPELELKREGAELVNIFRK